MNGIFVFDEYPGEEFTVRLSPVSLRAYFDFLTRWNQASTLAEFRAEIGTFVELAAPTWTLQAETFEDLDFALVKAIVNTWVAKVPEVPLPLPVEPSDTARRREPSTETPAAASDHRPSSSGRRRSTRS